MASEGVEHRMTARQAAIAAAEAAAGVGQERKPSMDVGVSSDGEEEEDGSEWEERGRRTTKAAKKKQRVDEKDKAAAGKAKPKNKGGRSKAQAADEDHQMEDVVELFPADPMEALKAEAQKLQTQIQRVEHAKAKAKELYELKMGLAAPGSHTEQNRMQDVDRHYRVLTEMVTADAEAHATHTDTTVKRQLDRCVAKLQIIQDKIDKLHQQQVVVPCLEGLPEALWMSSEEKFGLGAFVGFVPCLTSLSAVSTHFHTLTQDSNMHPIIQLNTSPSNDIIDELPVEQREALCRFSKTRHIRINHAPTPALIRLLESFKDSIKSVDLRGVKNKPDDNLPPPQQHIVFPQLHKATVHGKWHGIARDRKYKLPALKHLSTASFSNRGPGAYFLHVGAWQWIRNASSGLTSIHSTLQQSLVNVTAAIKDTPTVKSLICLTGFTFSSDNPYLYYPYYGLGGGGGGDKAPEDELIDLIGGGPQGGKLRKIKMQLPDLPKSKVIQRIHRFRAACLAPDATEIYRTTNNRISLQLPFDNEYGVGPLAQCLPTVQLYCARANTVTLRSHAGGPELGSLVFPHVKELTIVSFGYGVLPSYITSDPRAMFPNVKSVWVKQRGRAEFFEGGVGQVLGALPSIDHVTFELSTLANPDATLCLVPAGAAHLCAQGRRDVTVCVKSEIDFPSPHYNYTTHEYDPPQNYTAQWRVYGGEGDAGREFMASRVSRLKIDMRVRLLRNGDYGIPPRTTQHSGVCTVGRGTQAESSWQVACLA
ncbi:unnamed protein product [Vitrella brassicaformis CCMP3155]|uniref:Uncharacterized protein n=2 Tax=Vitrella brassicaformis TaxID=1169539 RepID=A0A0G4EN98_VITBC|nr:unnamed protein product [Vitrella brassicaformis CCMP3155]|eukprot:CEL98601.1 unnamed protein product [Vitrella brassicaformis CCMP3155]